MAALLIQELCACAGRSSARETSIVTIHGGVTPGMSKALDLRNNYRLRVAYYQL